MQAEDRLQQLQTRIITGGEDGAQAQAELLAIFRLGLQTRDEREEQEKQAAMEQLRMAIALLHERNRWAEVMACELAIRYVDIHGSKAWLLRACACLCTQVAVEDSARAHPNHDRISAGADEETGHEVVAYRRAGGSGYHPEALQSQPATIGTRAVLVSNAFRMRYGGCCGGNILENRPL